jgi:uncharacterized protein affecting Mg2+/Co2+ transport
VIPVANYISTTATIIFSVVIWKLIINKYFLKVRASAVLIPEAAANVQNDHANYTFSYSIRMSLQPEGCIIDGIPFSSCQLHWRHWIIRAYDRIVSEVNDEAVIGKVKFRTISYLV